MLGTVDAFDTDWLAAMSIGLFPLRSADPKAVANELSVIFGDAGKERPPTATKGSLPVERLNSVLAITPRPEYLERVRDGPASGSTAARMTARRSSSFTSSATGPAADLAGVLSNAFGGGGDLAPSRSRAAVAASHRRSARSSCAAAPTRRPSAARRRASRPAVRRVVSALEQQLSQARSGATGGGATPGRRPGQRRDRPVSAWAATGAGG